MNKKEALVVFTKNAVKGKVKSRLAASIGEDEALQIHNKLLKRTKTIVNLEEIRLFIYYSDYIEHEDDWPVDVFKKIQSGEDLGARMMNAFTNTFCEGYEKVVIIGTDCAQLETSHLNEAFMRLINNEVVIGPAYDGGYYLIGLNKIIPGLFRSIDWGTNEVLAQTLAICSELKLNTYLLPLLADVDREEDLKYLEEE